MSHEHRVLHLAAPLEKCNAMFFGARGGATVFQNVLDEVNELQRNDYTHNNCGAQGR